MLLINKYQIFYYLLYFSDFRLSRRLAVYINSVLLWLHCVDVGDVVDVSEVHVASIFRVEI
jgi:hypothetical protein